MNGLDQNAEMEASLGGKARSRRLFRISEFKRKMGMEEEIDEELRFHLESLAERYMAGGMDEAAAWEEVMARFPDLGAVRADLVRTRSQGRKRRSRRQALQDLNRDLRLSLRLLRKRPGFSFVVILTLALGIGANTAVFAVVDGILLEPLPYPDPDRLVVLWQTDDSDGDTDIPWSVPDLRDVAARTTELDGLAGYTWLDETLTGMGEPELVYAVGVTRGLLDIFATPPAMGRDIRTEETLAGSPRVALISHRFWTERFHGDPAAVGRTLQLSGLPHEIVGVAPEGFAFPSRADLWIGGQWPENGHPRDRHFLRAVGRISLDTDPSRVRAELDGIAAGLRDEHPESNRDRGIVTESLAQFTVGDSRTGLLVLLGAVGMVLLIACANVANLLLAQGSVRVNEMAIRSTLGAGRWSLFRQLVVESFVLATIGGGAGLLTAAVGLRGLRALSPGRLPRMDNVALDATVFLFAAGLALLVALAFGVLPALKLSRTSLAEAVRRGRDTDLQVRNRELARSGLLATEVALSVVLLLGAGLLMRSFVRIRSVDLGFQAEKVQQFTLTLPPARYDPELAASFYRDLEDRIDAIPGVQSVGMISGSPMGRSHTSMSFVIPSEPEPPPGEEPVWLVRHVTPGYFASLAIPIRRGRSITPSDGPNSPQVVVISQTAADRFWPGQDPVGQQILMEEDDPPWTIVGIVGDVRSLDVTEEEWPEAYFPHAQWARNTMTVEVLGAGLVPGLGNTLRETVHALDPNLPVYWMENLQDRVDESTASDRFYLVLIGSFAGLALLLATVGLYGVVAYLVSRRTREIGIRVALGASSRDVLEMVVAQGLGPVLLGLAAGVAAAVAGGRILESLLYQIQPLDPVTFMTVPVLLLLVTLGALAIPARAATRISPREAMREGE